MIFPNNIPSDPTFKEAKEMDGNGFRIFPLHSMVPREEQDLGEPFIGLSFGGPVGWNHTRKGIMELFCLDPWVPFFCQPSISESGACFPRARPWRDQCTKLSTALAAQLQQIFFARRGGPRHRHCGIFHHIAACATPSLPSLTATTGICTDHLFLTTGLARKDKKRGRPIGKAISCLEFPQAIQVVAVIDLGLHRRVDHDASKGIASLATKWPWAWCFGFRRVRPWNGTPTMCFVDDFTTILRRLFLWVLMISRRHSNLFILSLILTGRSQHFVGCMYSHVIECYWLSNISSMPHNNLWGSAKPQPPKEAGRELGESPTHQVHYYYSILQYDYCYLFFPLLFLPLSKKICKATRGLYIYTHTYELKHAPSDSCIFAANISPYHHMTIHTHNHALTYTHLYVHRHAQHEHSTDTSSQHHIPKHRLTHHNFTSHATKSVYLRLHTFTVLPPNLTSHENNITSHPHTHIHIRITCVCTSHILQTASFIRYTYR